MNLGQMRQHCLYRTGNRQADAHAEAMVDDMLNAEYSTVWAVQPFDWQRTTAVVTVAANNFSAALPADCDNVEMVVPVGGGRPYEHANFAIEAMLEGDPTVRTGLVTTAVWPGTGFKWDAKHRTLYVTPQPTAALAVTVWYWRSFTPLVLTTDAPLFSATYHQILPEGAIMRLGPGDNFDPAIIQMAAANHKRLWTAMLSRARAAKPAAARTRVAWGPTG